MRRWIRLFVGGALVGSLAGAGAFAAASGSDGTVGTAGGHAGDPVVARFVEQTVTSGVRHSYDGGFMFYVGGGVAAFDCDGDRRSDLYVAGGENEAGLYRNRSATGGDLSFDRVSSPVTDLTGVTGAYPLDIDSDGTLDLAVLRVGENVMLRGLGGCRFERADKMWSIDAGEAWTAAFSATWESDEGLPTLAFGNYLESVADEQNARDCVPGELVRPVDGSGYGPPTALEPGLCALSALFSDWNGTGRADLRFANDRHYYTEGSEQLWRVEPGVPPVLFGPDDGWERLSIWGMGIASGDVTGDGLDEVVLASQGDNKLQTLVGSGSAPQYTDIAIDAGTTAHRPFMGDATYPSTAWHPELADVNNDGVLDLLLSKGNVSSQVDHAADDPSNLLLGRGDATFVESAREAGVVSLGQGRGAALVDLNSDGMLDLVEVNRADNVRLWRNVGGGTADTPQPLGGWVALRLTQPAPNVDAVGAWVEVRTDAGVQRRQRTVGGGHAGGQLGWMHWGLGPETSAQVRVTWPDGGVSDWVEVASGQFVALDRSGGPRLWSPPDAQSAGEPDDGAS